MVAHNIVYKIKIIVRNFVVKKCKKKDYGFLVLYLHSEHYVASTHLFLIRYTKIDFPINGMMEDVCTLFPGVIYPNDFKNKSALMLLF